MKPFYESNTYEEFCADSVHMNLTDLIQDFPKDE